MIPNSKERYNNTYINEIDYKISHSPQIIRKVFPKSVFFNASSSPLPSTSNGSF